MIPRSRLVLPLLLLIIAALAAVALLMPRGGERMIARASTKVPAEQLQACLSEKLGLGAWAGSAPTLHASKFGLRVVVSDSGKERQVGLFSPGGRALSNSDSGGLEACLGATR